MFVFVAGDLGPDVANTKHQTTISGLHLLNFHLFYFLSLFLLETLDGRPWTERIIYFLSIRRGERG